MSRDDQKFLEAIVAAAVSLSWCNCGHSAHQHQVNPDGGASCRWCPNCDQYTEDRRVAS